MADQRRCGEPRARRVPSSAPARLRAGLFALSCCSVLATATVQADTNDTATAPSTAAVTDISLWVKDAPLSLVVTQLAQLSGREAEIEGSLGMPVSGRFHGSVAQALTDLSAAYPVLFDLEGDTLRATNGDSASHVSVAVPSEELSEEFRAQLFEQVSPGNDIEIRADAVRVSGHPAFVSRAAAMVTAAAADSGARHLVGQKAGADSDNAVADSATTVDQTAGQAVIDSGSDEMLADIADEAKPPADQAQLSRPIRWVTDIPGFHTF